MEDDGTTVNMQEIAEHLNSIVGRLPMQYRKESEGLSGDPAKVEAFFDLYASTSKYVASSLLSDEDNFITEEKEFRDKLVGVEHYKLAIIENLLLDYDYTSSEYFLVANSNYEDRIEAGCNYIKYLIRTS